MTSGGDFPWRLGANVLPSHRVQDRVDDQEADQDDAEERDGPAETASSSPAVTVVVPT